jgi:hypothetical protein
VTSANVELRPLEMLSLRAGGMVWPLPLFGAVPISVVGANLLIGSDGHHAELGLNYVKVWIDDDDARFLNPTMGYRYQPDSGGFLFRATMTPLIRTNDTDDVLPWAGVSFGWCGSL